MAAPSRRGTGLNDPAYPDWARHDLDEHEDRDEHRDDGRSFDARGAGSVGSDARDAVDAARSGARSAAQAVGSRASAAAEGVGRAARGAAAMAVGAALAGALPRTRREDDAFGGAMDDLFDKAERIFLDERRKAEIVAKAAVDEAGQIANEKRDAADRSAPGEKSAIEAAADEVRDAGKRVRGVAERQAGKEDLGNPRS